MESGDYNWPENPLVFSMTRYRQYPRAGSFPTVFRRLHSFMASFIRRRTLFNMNGGTPNKFIWFSRVPPRWRKTVPSKTMNVCTQLLSLAIVSVSTLWRIIIHLGNFFEKQLSCDFAQRIKIRKNDGIGTLIHRVQLEE